VSAAEEVAAVRAGAGLFRPGGRGLLRVAGGDRVRWLDGMVSNDVASLAPGPERSGCRALLLTRQGRIVADPHVLLRPDAFWLELPRAALAHTREVLDRFIIADDVTLEDASDAAERLSIEGPRAAATLAPELADHACGELSLGGHEVVVAAYGLAGAGRQLFVPPGATDAVVSALLEASPELVEAGAEALEILRIEAGVPALGPELDEEVLPAEARLEGAVSTTKGCYTGQEVVARMASRGRVSHLLVGLRFEGDAPPLPGSALEHEGKAVGEITSACTSPSEGAIALAFVRSAQAEPGTCLDAGGRPARVAALPFVPFAPAGSA
jgi:folate-binding protein YgfZ